MLKKDLENLNIEYDICLNRFNYLERLIKNLYLIVIHLNEVKSNLYFHDYNLDLKTIKNINKSRKQIIDKLIERKNELLIVKNNLKSLEILLKGLYEFN